MEVEIYFYLQSLHGENWEESVKLQTDTVDNWTLSRPTH